MTRLYILCLFQVAMFNLWQLFPEADQWHVYDVSLRIIIVSGILFVAIKPDRYGVQVLFIHAVFLTSDVLQVACFSDMHNPAVELSLYCGLMLMPLFVKWRDKRKGRP
jgi:hypothetical protein